MKRISTRSRIILTVIIVFLGGLVFLRRDCSIIKCGSSAPDAHIQQFHVALLSYRAKAGVFPTTEQGLKALVTKPTTAPAPRSWSSIIRTLPKDPWGGDYIYEQPGKHNRDAYDLYSPGADGIPSTADDIGNWEYDDSCSAVNRAPQDPVQPAFIRLLKQSTEFACPIIEELSRQSADPLSI